MTTRVELPIPAHALPPAPAATLLALARAGIDQAAETTTAGSRYAAAHLAALRAAAAVLAARATHTPGRREASPSVWVLLPQVAPELAEWAAFFAEQTWKRAAAEAGVPRVVTADEANDMVRAAGQFIGAVETRLGVTV